MESLLLAHLAGLKISEAPVKMRARAGGRSSITPLKSVYYMVKVMLVLFIWLVRKKPVPAELEVYQMHARVEFLAVIGEWACLS